MISLSDTTSAYRKYEVKLFFARPGDPDQQAKLMDVRVQQRNEAEILVMEAPGVQAESHYIQTFGDVLADQQLEIVLDSADPAADSLVSLCGVQIIAEGW